MGRIRSIKLFLGALLLGMPLIGSADNPLPEANYTDCSECLAGMSTASVGSINLVVNAGQLPLSDVLGSAALILEEHQPSILTATPQSLKFVVGSYSLKSMENVAGDTYFEFLIGSGKPIQFKVPSGESRGEPIGYNAGRDEYVVMADSGGSPVTYNPYCCILNDGHGNEFYFAIDDQEKYLLLYKAVSYHNTHTFSTEELDVVRDSNYVIEQVKTTSRLLDVIVEYDRKFRVDVYPIDVVSSTKDGVTHRYTASGTPMEQWVIVQSSSNQNLVTITQKRSGVEMRSLRYEYSSTEDCWTMTTNGDAGKEYNRYSQGVDSNGNKIFTREIGRHYGEAGQIIDYRTVETRETSFDWGFPVISFVESVGANKSPLETIYTYYESSTENGFTKRKTMTRSDGYWERYRYDANGRMTMKIIPWLDSDPTWEDVSGATCKVTVYSYNTATGSPFDNVPHTTLEKVFINGTAIITGKRTFSGYFGTRNFRYEYHTVWDSAGSSYQTIRSYYGGTLLPYNGKLHDVTHPDGTKDIYLYYQGNVGQDASFTIDSDDGMGQMTHILHKDSSGADITRTVEIVDEFGNLRQTRAEIPNGTGYALINRAIHYYDDLGHRTLTEYLDGTEESASWGNNCCGKESETDRTGITTSYIYDAQKRVDTATVNGIKTTYTYDAKGRILSTTVENIPESGDPTYTLTTSQTYDRRGRVTSSTDVKDLVTYTDYSTPRTETTTYPGGGTRIVSRYKDGRIKSITGTAVVAEYYKYGVDADGKTWTQIYIGNDPDEQTTAPRWTKTTTDWAGRVVTVEQPGYDEDDVGDDDYVGYTLKETRYYNTKNQCTKTVSSVLPSGSGVADKVTLMKYNNKGELYQTALDDGDGIFELTQDRITETIQSYVYDATAAAWFYKVETATYPSDNSSSRWVMSTDLTQLTGWGTPVSGLGQLTARSISQQKFQSGEDPEETVSSTYIDSANATVTQKVEVPTSSQEAVLVTINGQLKSETSTSGVTTQYDYDEIGRIQKIYSSSDADGNGTDDRTVSSTYAYYTSGAGAEGQVYTITDEDSNAVTYTYDADTGALATETKQDATLSDGTSQTITTTYTYEDATGRLKKVEDGQYPVEYHYDVYGQRDWMKTWRDATTSVITMWVYDETTGLLEQKLYDSDVNGSTGTGPSYTYYPDGQLKTRTWARSEGGSQIVTGYDYRNTGELWSIDYGDNNNPGQGEIVYTYDRLGRQKTISDGQGIRTFDYDTTSGLLDSETLKLGTVQKYKIDYSPNATVDPYGRAKGYDLYIGSSSTVAQRVTYGYEDPATEMGRFETVSFNIDEESDTFTYNWMDGANLLKGYTSSGTPAANVSYGYEANRDLKTLVKNDFGSSEKSKFTYVYDEVGRRKQRTDTIQQGTPVVNKFKYDVFSQLTAADMDGSAGYEENYTYDDIGNRTGTGYSPNNLNQDTYGAQYDLDGNLLYDSSWRYEWDAENRLIEMRTYRSDDVAIQNDKRIKFVYDYAGRRVKKSTYVYTTQWPTTAASTIEFIYDGWNLIYEKRTDSTATTTYGYVWGLDLSQSLNGAGGVGGLLAVVATSDNGVNDPYTSFEYPLADANGNIVQYLSSSGGVNASVGYDSFGNTVGSGSSQAYFHYRYAFLFSSKYQDYTPSGNVGLIYYGYRYYDPSRGMWISRDPIEEKGSLNLYGFVENQSINFTDRLGLDVYTAYRRLGGGWYAGPLWALRTGGHVYLAFEVDGPNVPPDKQRKWCAYLSRNGYTKTKSPTTLTKEYNNWITISFHPRSVESHDKAGNLIYTMVTDGSYVEMNNQKNDVTPVIGGLAMLNPISSDFETELEIFKHAEASMAVNGTDYAGIFSIGTGLFNGYGFLNNNCGGWAKYIIDKAGGSWPLENRLMNGGVSVGGPLHYPAKVVDLVPRSAVLAGGAVYGAGSFAYGVGERALEGAYDVGKHVLNFAKEYGEIVPVPSGDGTCGIGFQLRYSF